MPSSALPGASASPLMVSVQGSAGKQPHVLSWPGVSALCRARNKLWGSCCSYLLLLAAAQLLSTPATLEERADFPQEESYPEIELAALGPLPLL